MYKFNKASAILVFCALFSSLTYASDVDSLIDNITLESPVHNTTTQSSPQPLVLGVSNINIKKNAPLDYTVKKSDTVIKLSNKYLKKLSLWPNLLGVENLSSTKLYSGDKLKLVSVDGTRKILVVSLAGQKSNHYQKLTPQIRTEPINASDYISAFNLRNFMLDVVVMDKESYNKLPTVVGSSNDLAVYYSMGDSIYVKGYQGNVGERVLVISDFRPLKDPTTKEFLGEEYRVNGYGVISSIDKISNLELTSAPNAIMALNRVVKVDNTMDFNIVPHHMESEVNGQIIALYDSLSATGEYNNVVINRGARDGVELGGVFDITNGRKIKDPTSNSDDDKYFDSPQQSIGELLVYKVEDKVSFALVTDSQSEILINSKIKSQ